MEPITEYKEKVVNFRHWLRREFEDYHAKDIYEAKWYVQAIGFAEKGEFESVFRACGLDASLANAFTLKK